MEASQPVQPPPSGYPVTFAVDYPDRDLDRLTSFFRIFTAIPILIVAAALAGGAGILFFPTLLLILFREKYPRWWYDWNLNFQRFLNRIAVYLALMDDRYPSTDDEQAVHLVYPYPEVGADVHRGMPLVKWFLAIPHYLVLIALWLGALLAVIAAWFAILFTGRYPQGLFDYVEGVMRWHNRVFGYAFTLVTDQYPPFRLAP